MPEEHVRIYKHDNLRKKYSEVLHIYELISIVGIEAFNEINVFKFKNDHLKFDSEINKIVKNYSNLILYCNNELKKISASYNNKVLQINETWDITNQLFKLNDYKDNIGINYNKNNQGAGSSKDPL